LKDLGRDVVWYLLKDLVGHRAWDHQWVVEDAEQIEEAGAREQDDR
jgi:hypothetical protein